MLTFLKSNGGVLEMRGIELYVKKVDI